ncbi:phenylalanine--tRNA ligase subunit beta [Patescibacteria group bacterium]|nr:phenylalanine--tRNA ligase subunit beta [Patescibacteria group bacterium]
MNILVPHSWLSEYLNTDATPRKIAESLALCGPSVEKIEKIGDDWVYDIEVTTNRVDMMSVYGIAREAYAILPQFGYKAKIKPYKPQKTEGTKKLDIEITNNPKLCNRILAIKLENVELGPSPQWLSDRLEKVGQRPLNNAIDITNYVMWEIGHPIHVFDYDRLVNKKILVREAKKGETLITLDGIKYTLNGGEVVFSDGSGEIIDLPGIMGTANTVVTKNTKNVLLWIESIDPVKIRSASMGLNIRSQAAILNEKQVDPELGRPAILRTIELYKKVTKAHPASLLVDIYPAPYKVQKIKTTGAFMNARLGADIAKNQIKKILEGLEFETSWVGNNLEVQVPSFRAHDISIPEDIVEEVARIYGYHNLPSELMTGAIPKTHTDSPFSFESNLKNILKGLGGIEVYSSSLVPKDYIEGNALKLKNPLGTESEYMRISLMPSLIGAAGKNSGEKDPFHLFEMANVYIPQRGDLPDEKMTLAGIFSNYDYRVAKGILKALLEELNVKTTFIQEDFKNFLPSKRLSILVNARKSGQFGVLEENDYIFYEFGVEQLRKGGVSPTYIPIPKYPAQIEDLTLVLPDRTKVGEVIETIKLSGRQINNVELTDIYKDSYTFRVWYQNPKKTLTDKEVESIRKKILVGVKKKFGATF